MTFPINRRTFVKSAAVSGAFTIVPRHVLGGGGYVPPSDKIALAYIGMGTQGLKEIGTLLGNPKVQIVAVCDPNTYSNDYVEWNKNEIRDGIRNLIGNPTWRENESGCAGGRDVGQEVVNAYYAKERGPGSFKGCSAYADFRELFDKEKDVNAVKIMTPDHLHATIAIAAMKKGMHVEMHKPIANRMAEARLVIETARKTQVKTHFIPYDSGDLMRFVTARINDGAIGALREVHNWSSRPMWPQYAEIPTGRPAIPKGFDWNLWLGPELDRPYSPHYTHAVFRGWYDFGGGSLADMGHYSLWPVFTAFKLGSPLSAEPWLTHTCTIVDQVSRRVRNDFSFPAACTIRFKYAARGEMPALDLYWYDGGMRPGIPDEVEADNQELPAEGILFIGDRGKIAAGFNGQNPQIYPKYKSDSLGNPPAFQRGARRAPAEAGGARDLWVGAMAGGEPSPGNFLNAASISDTVNLGAIALRVGRKVQFDSESMKITNMPEANKYLYREYRKGWEL